MSAANDDLSLLTDKFGVRKLLIAGTKVGKVFAIRTDNGEMVWSRQFANALRDIREIRSVHVKVPPVLSVATQKKEKSTVYRLNALNGEDWSEQGLPSKTELDSDLLKIFSLPLTEELTKTTTLALLDSNGEVL